MDVNLVWVLVGCALIGAGSAMVGSFAFLRKQSLVGDAVSHALLPGICIAFLLTKEKSLVVLFPGALVAGWLSMLSIDLINSRSKIKPDSAIAIVLSTFFAFGIALLTYIQQGDFGNQSGLNSFLFGKAASMLPRDITLFIIVDSLLMISIWLFYPYLKLFSFDSEFSTAVGLPVKFLRFILSTLTVMAVATGIQAVGVVLMAALLITPAAAARYLAKGLGGLIGLSVLIGIISSTVGVLLSYSISAMPTGPMIVVVLSMLAIGVFLFAPRKGLVDRYLMRTRHRRKMLDENVLKALFYLTDDNTSTPVETSVLSATRKFEGKSLTNALGRLERSGNLERLDNKVILTDAGNKEAARIVRIHRLWELYLSKRMNIAADHVHTDAEAIEHIITPELEAELLKDLNYPVLDPHKSIIPGVEKQ